MLKIEINQKKIPAKKESIKISLIDVKRGRKEKNITKRKNKKSSIINSSTQPKIQKYKYPENYQLSLNLRNKPLNLPK